MTRATVSARGAEPPSVEAGAGGELVRVVVLERDPLLRAGLRSLLRPDPRIDVVADLASRWEITASLPVAEPDLLLMSGEWLREDVSASGNTPSDRGFWHQLPAVVVLDVSDWTTLSRAVSTKRVRGFVDRNTSQQDLRTAVLEAAAGRTFLSSTVAKSVVEWMATRMDREPTSLTLVETVLTGREMEIFEAMGQGVTNTVIARQLGIQETTVRSHVYRILTKLNLRTRTEAALAAYKYADRVSPHVG
ncbi:response regulator transcription factor [Streptomyces sp. NBC_01102]|uniref:LuxR C-terminal-related transcriptional regulator n=1 Tax=unclassified Streptomyces TaxID=2593676 RepID=UPI00386E4DD7|nr:response regulator transcription factor [Streptomyces sp. NBC_01102]